MKKSYLMIAAAAALFAACAETDTFKEINNTEGPAINFSTYAQKATRAAENSDSTYSLNLKDHHLTFKVWGYKNTTTDPVFFQDSVGYSGSNWSYLNKRYWDKAATVYEFYAFAPYDAPFTFNGVSSIETQKDGYFSIAAGYNKAGENVAQKSTTPVSAWKTYAQNDVDLMIADTCRLMLSDGSLASAQGTSVTMNFIHILSRLNITVKTVTGLNPDVATDDSLKVTKITLSNFAHSGAFSETNGSLSADQLRAGTTARWIPKDTLNYEYPIDYKANLEDTYVIEALMIPQQILSDTINLNGTFPAETTDNKAPYIKIEYSIYSYNSKENTKTAQQDYVAYYNLAKLFNIAKGSRLAFNEGWQNTLKITISPAAINFDAKVAPWYETEAKELEVK